MPPNMCVYRIDNKGKTSFHSKQQLDIYSDGYAVEISHLGSGMCARCLGHVQQRQFNSTPPYNGICMCVWYKCFSIMKISLLGMIYL